MCLYRFTSPWYSAVHLHARTLSKGRMINFYQSEWARTNSVDDTEQPESFHRKLCPKLLMEVKVRTAERNKVGRYVCIKKHCIHITFFVVDVVEGHLDEPSNGL